MKRRSRWRTIGCGLAVFVMTGLLPTVHAAELYIQGSTLQWTVARPFRCARIILGGGEMASDAVLDIGAGGIVTGALDVVHHGTTNACVLQNASDGEAVFQGLISLAQGGALVLRKTGSESLWISGGLFGEGELVKEGAGRVMLTTGETGSNLIRVTEGALVLSNVQNSAAVAVSHGAVLAGNGSVGAVTNYGTLFSTYQEVGGAITCSSLAMKSGSEYLFAINGTSPDLVQVNGSLVFDEGSPVTLTVTNQGGTFFRDFKVIEVNGGTSAGNPSWTIAGDIPEGIQHILEVTKESEDWYLTGGRNVDCNILDGMHGEDDLIIRVNAKTVETVPYDLIYFDSENYDNTTQTNAWKFSTQEMAAGVWTTFTNNLSTLNANSLRFLRVSPMGAWSNEVGRLASPEIYVAKRVKLYPGRNWIALPCVPQNPTYSNVFGYSLPGFPSKISATCVDLYGISNDTLVVTNSAYFTGEHWYSETLKQNVDNVQLPLNQGFMVHLPQGAPSEFAVVGELRTWTNQISMAGAGGMSFVSVLLPCTTHPSNLNLTASGFKGGRRLMESDELYIWDRVSQSAKGYGNGKALWMWYKTTDKLWYWSDGTKVTGKPIGQDDALIIYRKSGNGWNWVNPIGYSVPTKDMTP